MRSALVLIALLFALAVPAAAGADSGTYTVYSCRLPDGSPARVDGWRVAPLFPSVDHFGNACPAGGLWMQMDPNVTHDKDDVVRMLFTPAPDTQIVHYKLWRSAVVGSGTQYFVTEIERHAGSETWVGPNCKGLSCTTMGDASAGVAPVNLFEANPYGGSDGVGLYLSCGYSGPDAPDCPGANPAGYVVLYGAQVTVADAYPPSLAIDHTGLLDSSRTLSGVKSASVLATDRGGGVARVGVLVDGVPVADTVLDDNDGACAQPYESPAPCPTTVSGTVPVDTSALPTGAHEVQVTATDAAGNVTKSSPVTIHTTNRICDPKPLAHGQGSIRSWLVKVGVRRRRGHRAVRTTRKVRTLTIVAGGSTTLHAALAGGDGRPLAAAAVCLGEQAAGSDGQAPTEIARLTSDGNGAITFKLPPGPSRTVWVVHPTAGGVLAASVRVNVRPKVTASPSRRRLTNGDVLVIRGRVVGGPIPRRGVLVELQARVGDHWQTFKTIRSSGRGAWRTTYRFTRTAGVQHYALRAQVPVQSGYPYAEGTSRALRVTVRG